MILTFSPVRMDTRLEASVDGDTLTLNGEAFDFAPLPEGATLPRAAIRSDWFAGDVRRVKGVLHLDLVLPHGAGAATTTLHPQMISVESGVVDLPAYEEGCDDAEY